MLTGDSRTTAEAVAFLRADSKSMAEVYVAGLTAGAGRPVKLTDMNAEIAGWIGDTNFLITSLI